MLHGTSRTEGCWLQEGSRMVRDWDEYRFIRQIIFYSTFFSIKSKMRFTSQPDPLYFGIG